MKHFSRRSARSLSATLVLAAILTLLVACVSRGKHQAIVTGLENENARLEQRTLDLERTNRALDDERVALIDEMEDLRQVRESLANDVAMLEKSKTLLTEHLRDREERLDELSRLSGTYAELVSELESEVAAGQIRIDQLQDGLRLNLSQDILFPSGSVDLQPNGEKVLRKVAGKLRKTDHRIEVQGHSDDMGLSRALASRWGSNWELAAARASRVVRVFESEKLDPARLSVVSYGPNMPVATNDTPEGRALNRRIDIRLIPVSAAMPAVQSTADDAPEAASETP